MNGTNGFTTPIRDSRIEAVLEHLHAAADEEEAQRGPRPRDRENRDWGPNFLKDKMIPVDRQQGALIYLLARSTKAKTIVEFGTSHGLSTIYLAAAIRETVQAGKSSEPSSSPRKWPRPSAIWSKLAWRPLRAFNPAMPGKH